MLESLVMHWNRSTKLNTYRGTSVYSWNWFQVVEGTLFCSKIFFFIIFPFRFFATIIEMYFFVFKVNRCNISWWYHSDIFSFKWLSPLFPTEKSQKIKKPRNFGPKWSIMNRKKMKKNEICFLDLTNYSSLLITFNILLTQAKRKLFKDLMFHLTFMLK